MALFGVLVEPSEIAKDFVKVAKEKLADNNLVRNPFNAKIKSFVIGDSNNKIKDLYVISMSPIYFNYSIFGWIYVIAIFIFKGITYWLIPGVVVGLGTIFWLKEFYYFMFKLGLRKKGYKGDIKMLRANDILEELHFRSFN